MSGRYRERSPDRYDRRDRSPDRSRVRNDRSPDRRDRRSRSRDRYDHDANRRSRSPDRRYSHHDRSHPPPLNMIREPTGHSNSRANNDVYEDASKKAEAKLQKQEKLALARKLLRGGENGVEEVDEGEEVTIATVPKNASKLVNSQVSQSIPGVVNADDSEMDDEAMMAMLGFGSFDSTKVSNDS